MAKYLLDSVPIIDGIITEPPSGAGSTGFGTSAIDSVAQSFTGTGVPISSAKLWFKTFGSATGTVQAYIYAHAGTYGTSSVPTGSPLATSLNTLDATTLASTYAPFTFTFDNTLTLTAGTNYVIVVTSNTVGTSPNVPFVASGSGLASGNYSTGLGGSYTPVNSDLYFQVLTSPSTTDAYLLESAAQSTYYFDGHTSITDPGSNWTNAANAFDGSITTFATPTSNSNGTNYLEGAGTNAPSSGGTITSVSARIYGSSSSLGRRTNANIYTAGKAETLSSGAIQSVNTTGATDWGAYAVLTAPAAGWSWSTLQNLVADILDADITCVPYRLEISVTYTPSATDAYALEPFGASQNATKKTAGGTSTTTGMTTTTGNALLVGVGLDDVSATVTNVTDNKGNTFTRANSIHGGDFNSSELWYCGNITGGAGHTITATSSNSGDNVFVTAMEFVSYNGPLTIDQTTANHTSGVTTGGTGTTPTTTAADEIAIAFSANDTGHAMTSTYTGTTTLVTAGTLGTAMGYSFLSATGTQSATFTDSASADMATVIATFKVGSVSTATTTAITKSARYTINKTPTALTKTTRYTTKKITGLTESMRYVIKKPVALTKGIIYKTKLPTSITKSARYTVKRLTALTKSARYTVKRTTALTKAAIYTAKRPSALTKSTRYAIKTPITSLTKTAKYSVLMRAGQPNGLITYWNFDDATGTTVTDAYGTNPGTWTGTVSGQWGTGKINGSGVFNGTDYVLVGDNASLSFNTGTYTLSAWVKTSATSRQTVLHKYQYTGTSVESGYYIDMLAGGNIRTVYETTNANLRNSDSSITVNDGNWHLITIVRPSTTGDILLYIDGVLDGGVTHAFNSGTPGSIDNTIPFAIGQSISTSIGVNNWNGSIDEVGVWNRALTSTEITGLYNGGAGKTFPFYGRIFKALTYKVTTATTRAITASARYAIKRPIVVTKSIKYTVKRSASAVTKAARYAIKQPIGMVYNLRYTVKHPVAVTKTLKYTLKSPTAITKTLKYTIRTTPSAIIKAISYRTDKVTSITKPLRYDLRMPTISLTKTGKYTVVTTPGRTSILSNGDFETGSGTTNANFAVPGWAVTNVAAASTVSVDTTTFHAGTQSIKLVIDATGSNNGLATATGYTMPVLPLTGYMLSMWVKSDTAGQLQVQLRTDRFSGNYLQPDGVTWNATAVYQNVATTTGWTQFTFAFTTSAGQTTVAISDFKRSSVTSQAGRTFWIDDVSIVQPGLLITKGVKYAVKNPSALTKTLKYTVSRGLPITKNTKYTVKRTASAITKSTRYAIMHQTAFAYSLRYDVRLPSTAITKALKYEIKRPVALTKALAYKVKTSTAATKSLTYIVTGGNRSIKAITYTITAPKVVAKQLQYAVLTTFSPVQTVTLGRTGDGTSVQTQNADRKYVSRAIPTSTGILKSGVARVFLSAPATSNSRLVIYSDSSSNPDQLLATSDEVIITNITEQAIAYTFSGVNQITIQNGVPYWIGIHFSAPGVLPGFEISRANTAGTVKSSLDTYSDGASQTFGAPGTSNGPLDIYVNYEALAGLYKSLQYTVRPTSAPVKSLKYAVITTATLAKQTIYRIKRPNAQTKGLIYDVRKSTAITKPVQYRVRTITNKTKGMQYDVRRTSATTKGLRYTTKQVTSLTKSSRYSIRTFHSKTASLTYRLNTAARLTKSLWYVISLAPTVTRAIVLSQQPEPVILSSTSEIISLQQESHTLRLTIEEDIRVLQIEQSSNSVMLQ